eukprot:3777055-Pleurochrysis_carterae.AAC.4
MKSACAMQATRKRAVNTQPAWSSDEVGANSFDQEEHPACDGRAVRAWTHRAAMQPQVAP